MHGRISVEILLMIVLPAAIACAQPPTPTPRPADPTSGPTKRALLIGVQEYGAGTEQWKPLKGPRNDVALMRSVLTSERFGFADSDIVTLLDGEATYAAIKAAFAELAESARAGDLVYVHYSGHGSTVRDANGDEPLVAGEAGLDSTLVPFDARADDSREVLDEEIGVWLARMRCRSVDVVGVFDSCHSGSITRAVNSVANRSAAEPDERDYAWSRGLLDEMNEAEACIPPDDKFVRISASQDNQYAIEFLPRGQRKRYGLLTWHWARALEEARPTDSYSTVFTRVQALIKDRQGERQRPHLEGATQVAVLGGRFAEPRRELAVQEVRSSSVAFQGGLLRGISKGSVFRKRGTGGAGEPNAVDIKLSAVGPQTSEGPRPANGTVRVGDLFEETVRAYPFPKLRVWVWDDESGASTVVDALREQVDTIVGVELVTSADVPDMLLRVFNEDDAVRCSMLDNAELPYGGGGIDPDLLSMTMTGAGAIEAVAQNLVRIEQNRSILGFLGAFEDRSGDVHTELLSLEFAGAGNQAAATSEWWSGDRDLAAPGLTHRVMAEGEGEGEGETDVVGVTSGSIVVFRIENTGDQLVYVYLANLKPSGEVKLRRGVDENQAKLEPDRPTLVAPTLIEDRTGLLDRYLWLVSSRPIEAWVLEGVPLRTRGPGTTIRTSLDELLDRVGNVSERGQGLDVAEEIELAVQRFDLAIVPAH